MQAIKDVQLSQFSTMRLGGQAKFLAKISQRDELPEANKWARDKQLDIIMIGGGSNVFWRDEGFDGLILVNQIMGYDRTELEDGYQLTVGAGEDWDSVVKRSVTDGLSGIECLSLIPGTAGATPVQNVGAYGQEIADCLVDIEAFDRESGQFVRLTPADCDFGYRTSRFKAGPDRDRFFITSIRLKLTRSRLQPPFYNSLQHYLDDNNIADYTPAALRQAVIAIRSAKLPDPTKIANNGSFFGNPVVSQAEFDKLQASYPDLPHWASGDKVKLSAAWLIDQAGFKDVHDDDTGMATWPTQPLVLVNESAKSTADLLAFRQTIVDTIQQKFGVELAQEPELLP